MAKKDINTRFWEKVDTSGDCWEWTASKSTAGYGQISRVGKRGPAQAHRVSYELHNGEIPDGLFICHKCDNRGCVNPDHLFAGTPKDNSQDMLKKGRRFQPKVDGMNSSHSKLTNEQVRYIRASGATQTNLAKVFGVTQAAVWYIKARRTYRNVI